MWRVACLYLVLASVACGPSLRQVHADTESFERCYTADHDPEATANTRKACWSAWLADHAETQPPERIKFAEERLQALESDPSTRPLPNAPPTPRPVFEHDYPPAAPGAYHTSGCDPLCHAGWSDCTNRCELRDDPCKTACENEFRICLSGCP